jgi:replicative DNA helicase
METLEKIIKEIKREEEIKKQDRFLGIPSGFKDLDAITFGFRNGQLTILAGRPAMGHATLALNIAQNITKHTNKRVAIFSLDETAKKITSDILRAELAGFRTEELDDKIINMPIFIDDQESLSILDIMERASLAKHAQNIDFIIIDYLQLIKGAELKKTKNKTMNFEKIVRLLKILAKSLNIPILLLSMIPRQAEKREGYKAMLRDLAKYGSIEKYADVILLLFYWEYYGLTEDESGKNIKNQALLTIAKNRNGLTEEIRISRDYKAGKFSDIG